MKSTFLTLIKNLNDEHKKCLIWFQNNKGKTIHGWPEKISDRYFLATKAKGIYKPKGLKYALSIRRSLKGPYKDILKENNFNKKFNFEYFQENKDIRKNLFEYTNVAMTNCISDVIPIGVIIQTKSKPQSTYKILGTGIVKKWEKGYFFIKGFDENGEI